MRLKSNLETTRCEVTGKGGKLSFSAFASPKDFLFNGQAPNEPSSSFILEVCVMLKFSIQDLGGTSTP